MIWTWRHCVPASKSIYWCRVFPDWRNRLHGCNRICIRWGRRDRGLSAQWMSKTEHHANNENTLNWIPHSHRPLMPQHFLITDINSKSQTNCLTANCKSNEAAWTSSTSPAQAYSIYRIAGPFTSIPLIIIFSSSTFGEISNAACRLTYSSITKR